MLDSKHSRTHNHVNRGVLSNGLHCVTTFALYQPEILGEAREGLFNAFLTPACVLAWYVSFHKPW